MFGFRLYMGQKKWTHDYRLAIFGNLTNIKMWYWKDWYSDLVPWSLINLSNIIGVQTGILDLFLSRN